MLTDQDQINERNCCLIIKGGTLTARMLALAMRAFLHTGKVVGRNLTTHHGKQTLRQISKSGGKLESVEVGEDVKSFEGIARKHGVDFAVKQDLSSDTPRHLVFFKSRDAASMDLAFREFMAKNLTRGKEKPSLDQTLEQMQAKIQNQVLDLNKHKDRGLER